MRGTYKCNTSHFIFEILRVSQLKMLTDVNSIQKISFPSIGLNLRLGANTKSFISFGTEQAMK